MITFTWHFHRPSNESFRLIRDKTQHSCQWRCVSLFSCRMKIIIFTPFSNSFFALDGDNTEVLQGRFILFLSGTRNPYIYARFVLAADDFCAVSGGSTFTWSFMPPQNYTGMENICSISESPPTATRSPAVSTELTQNSDGATSLSISIRSFITSGISQPLVSAKQNVHT